MISSLGTASLSASSSLVKPSILGQAGNEVEWIKSGGSAASAIARTIAAAIPVIAGLSLAAVMAPLTGTVVAGGLIIAIALLIICADPEPVYSPSRYQEVVRIPQPVPRTVWVTGSSIPAPGGPLVPPPSANGHGSAHHAVGYRHGSSPGAPLTPPPSTSPGNVHEPAHHVVGVRHGTSASAHPPVPPLASSQNHTVGHRH